jgi:hypothetical protein
MTGISSEVQAFMAGRAVERPARAKRRDPVTLGTGPLGVAAAESHEGSEFRSPSKEGQSAADRPDRQRASTTTGKPEIPNPRQMGILSNSCSEPFLFSKRARLRRDILPRR